MVRGRPKNTSVWEESDDEGVDGAKLEGGDLHKYAQRGNAKAVAMIIRRGGRSKLKVNLNELDGEGRTPLIVACANGQTRIVDFLCQAGADADIKDNRGLAAIHHCVLGVKANGSGMSATCVRALAKNNASIDRKTADGLTALHLAVKMNLVDISYVLKDVGADVNKFSTEGYNAIHYGVVSTLSKERAVDNIKQLMRLGIDVNTKHPETGSTALHTACEHEMPDVARHLIACKGEPLEQDNHGNTPLHIAAAKGSLVCVAAVITGFNVNVLGNQNTIKFGKKKSGGGGDTNADEQRTVVRDDKTKEMLAPLLNAQNDSGNTPMHIACEYGYIGVVDHLLMASADTSIKNNDGKCCFHLCAEIGHVKILEKLIVREVDTSIATDDGHTVVHYCAINNDAEVCKMQLQCFPRPNDQTDQGWTPLHYAAEYDSLQTIVMLLDWRADAGIENNEMKTPMDYARRPKTERALQGLMKEVLMREAIEKDNRLNKIQEERDKKKQAMKEESAIKAAERRANAQAVSSDSEEEDGGFDPLAVKKETRRDPMAGMFRREINGPMPNSKPSSGKAMVISHKADRMERGSPRRISRVEEKEKRIAREQAEQAEEDKLLAAELGIDVETINRMRADDGEVSALIRPPPWHNVLDRGWFEIDKHLKISKRLHLQKEHAKRINPWSYGLFECFSGPECFDNVCLASFCPCYITSRNALPLTKADGVRCCVGKLWKGCWCDCAIRTFTYPLCHWTNHMLVRRAIRKKYGLQEDPACPDSYAVCCCFPCALVQEANELRQHGADIRDRRHVATVNRMEEGMA